MNLSEDIDGLEEPVWLGYEYDFDFPGEIAVYDGFESDWESMTDSESISSALSTNEFESNSDESSSDSVEVVDNLDVDANSDESNADATNSSQHRLTEEAAAQIDNEPVGHGNETVSDHAAELMDTDCEPSDRIICRVDHPPSTKSKVPSNADASFSEEDGQTCSICFEVLTNAGEHRVTSLKCGHLFGHKCVLTWLKGSGTRCPQCNLKAKKSDIRIIYARSLKVQDTTELNRVLEKLEREKSTRRKAEIEMAQIKIQYEFLKVECSDLRTKIGQYKCADKMDVLPLAANSTSSAVNFIFEKSLEISKDGCCRVLASCEALNMIAVSQPSTNSLFPGYGVKKISVVDFKTSEFIRLHSHPIRDMTFNPGTDGGLLLSVSMDKSIRITSMLGNSVVQTYSYEMPLWSCAWNLDNPCQFFAGTVNGKILLFDTRNTTQHLDIIHGTGSHSPVVSLQYIKRNLSPTFKFSGLLACQLDLCVFHQLRASDAYRPHILPVQGNFTSVNFDSESQHFLLTSRPHLAVKQSRHLLCEMQSVCDVATEESPSIGCNVLRTMMGGRAHKMLSRSKLVSCAGSDPMRLLACAGDETSLSTMVWDVSADKFLTRLSVPSPVLDIASVMSASNQYILFLTEKSLIVNRLECSV